MHRVPRFAYVLILLTSVLTCSPSSAALIVSFSASTPSPISTGGSGLIDVFVQTDAGTQSLDGFQLQLGITPTGGAPAGGLVFADPQGDSQLNVGGANGYVFFGNSLSQVTSVPVGTVTGGGTIYTGFDATNDLVPVTLNSTPRLLYRINLNGITAGNYNLTVNPLADPSFFTDQIDPTNTGIAFSSSPATITVAGAAAVPEPNSLIAFAVGAVVIACNRRRNRVPKKES